MVARQVTQHVLCYQAWRSHLLNALGGIAPSLETKGTGKEDGSEPGTTPPAGSTTVVAAEATGEEEEEEDNEEGNHDDTNTTTANTNGDATGSAAAASTEATPGGAGGGAGAGASDDTEGETQQVGFPQRRIRGGGWYEAAAQHWEVSGTTKRWPTNTSTQ